MQCLLYKCSEFLFPYIYISQEADNWTTLSADVDKVFDSGDVQAVRFKFFYSLLMRLCSILASPQKNKGRTNLIFIKLRIFKNETVFFLKCFFPWWTLHKALFLEHRFCLRRHDQTKYETDHLWQNVNNMCASKGSDLIGSQKACS